MPTALVELHATCAAAFALKEAHTYHVDYPGLLATREVLLGFGRRLAGEGLLDNADDIWYLTRDVLRDALTEATNVRALVAEQRAELARGLVEGPRPYLGDPPRQVERPAALEKFYGSGGRALTGAGASAGVAEGIARVVAGPSDFGRQSGRDPRDDDDGVDSPLPVAWWPGHRNRRDPESRRRGCSRVRLARRGGRLGRLHRYRRRRARTH